MNYVYSTLLKYDLDGNSIWNIELPNHRITDFNLDNLGNIYIAGRIRNKFSSSIISREGYLVSSSEYKNGIASSVAVVLEGNFFVAGNTGESVYTTIKYSGSVIGLDPTGNNAPQTYSLSNNYPNPFNPVTTLNYSLPRSGDVSLIIYNILGEEVIRLVDGFQQAGEYNAIWNASNIASGIYFYRLQAGDFTETKKMVLLK